MDKETLLIVEDDAELSNLYQEVFKNRGWHVLATHDGERAIQYALENSPTIILLDLMLPKKGGLHVLRILKSLPETKQIPVAVMTAYPNPEYKEEAVAAGAAMYFLKSEFSHAQMADKIEEIVRGSA